MKKMLNKINQMILASALLLGLATPVVAKAPVFAAGDDDRIQSGLCGGSELKFETNNSGKCETVGGDAEERVNGIITNVINIFSIVVGVIAVIMIIIGGMKYITSGGESGKVTGAKNTILYAVIGLVVVALAQIIVKFVLAKATQKQ